MVDAEKRMFRPLVVAGWCVVLGSLAVTAVAVGGSPDIQVYQDSDTFIYSLSSTYAWTPFFWGQDRLGMFFPLAAMPVADPLWNMATQSILMCFCGLAAPVLLGWYFTDARRGTIIGLLISLGLLYMLCYWQVWSVLVAHCEYLGALCFALAGMVVLSSAPAGRLPPRAPSAGRVIAGGILILLGCWINIAMPALLVPVIVGRWLIGRDIECIPKSLTQTKHQPLEGGTNTVDRATNGPLSAGVLRWFFAGQRAGYMWSIILLVLSAAAVKLLAVAMHLPKSSFGLTPASQWPAGWKAMLDAAGDFLRFIPGWQLMRDEWIFARRCMLVAVAAVTLLRLPSKGGLAALGRACKVAAALAVPAVGYFLLAGTFEHVREYQYGWRYALPSVFLLAAGLVSFGVVMASSWLAAWRGAPAIVLIAALVIAMPALAMHWYEPPSDAGIQQAWDQRDAWTCDGCAGTLGDRCREVIDKGCTHVGGHMWHTWDTVFYTNLLLTRSGSDRRVYGMSWRGEELYPLWRDMPASKIRLGSMRYDWRQDMYHLNAAGCCPSIDPAPVEKTKYLEIHVAKSSQ